MTTLILAALLIAQAGPSAAPAAMTAATPAVVVHLKNYKYAPAVVRIKPGETVEWINDDNDAHTVDSTTKAFDSGGLDQNDTFTHAFTSAGSFAYFCSLHPYMKGVVIVASSPAK